MAILGLKHMTDSALVKAYSVAVNRYSSLRSTLEFHGNVELLDITSSQVDELKNEVEGRGINIEDAHNSPSPSDFPF